METNDSKDFKTHLLYLDFLAYFSEKLKMSSRCSFKPQKIEQQYINRKVNLIRLNESSIRRELEVVLGDHQYAIMCVPWISVKSYYLIFHHLLILKYLITSDKSAFHTKHTEIMDWFTKQIKSNSLEFNNKYFNLLISLQDLSIIKVSRGENLKVIDVDPDIRHVQILRKIGSYKMEHYKHVNKLNLRKKKDQYLFHQFKQNEVSLFEFFYWYRIRSNYEELEYLESNLLESELVNYFRFYCQFTTNFAHALKEVINIVSVMRTNKEIFFVT